MADQSKAIGEPLWPIVQLVDHLLRGWITARSTFQDQCASANLLATMANPLTVRNRSLVGAQKP
jgi:hypothetical protein